MTHLSLGQHQLSRKDASAATGATLALRSLDGLGVDSLESQIFHVVSELLEPAAKTYGMESAIRKAPPAPNPYPLGPNFLA
jgi:hypothetical protein